MRDAKEIAAGLAKRMAKGCAPTFKVVARPPAVLRVPGPSHIARTNPT